MTKGGPTKKQGGKEPSLSIPGKLPFEGYASEVKIADLVKMLVHTGALSIRDYELLVMRGHMLPLIESMTDDNWMRIRDQLLEFLKEWQDPASDDTELPKGA